MASRIRVGDVMTKEVRDIELPAGWRAYFRMSGDLLLVIFEHDGAVRQVYQAAPGQLVTII